MYQPWLVEDDECELCDEPALPYDKNADYGFCAEHSLQMITGTGIGDLIIDADLQRIMEVNRLHEGDLPVHTVCSCWGCPDKALPRMKHLLDSPDVLRSVTNLCTLCAMGLFGPDPLLSRRDWQDILANFTCD
jgi:hypothetical protein